METRGCHPEDDEEAVAEEVQARRRKMTPILMMIYRNLRSSSHPPWTFGARSNERRTKNGGNAPNAYTSVGSLQTRMTHQSWSRSGVGSIDSVEKVIHKHIVHIAIFIEGWRTETQMIRVRLDHDHHAADQDATMAMVSHKLPIITDIWALLPIHKGMANLLRGSDETWDYENLS